MPPRPRPTARPRPGPGPVAPAAVDPAPAAASVGGTRHVLRGLTAVPGLVAAGLRPLSARPRAAQRGAIGGLFGGIGVFVLLCTTTNGAVIAAAPVAVTPPPAVAPVQQTAAQPLVTPMPVRAALGAPAVSRSQQKNAKDGGKDASASHGVISGLAANGIPSVALNAYRVAAARMANVQPGCGIPWYLLAGIGREESDHGRFGGAVLHADGVSTPAIIGPALDGIHWDLIPAPANGLALDGDATYAHALGPMQFIPSTWDRYGADANGDGKADIFNINDAALGAARYLCAAGGDLTTVQGQTQAVLAYNHNSQYLAQVLALAEAYHKGITITGLPVGITSGQLPALVSNGYIPPANPAAPTAVGKDKPCPTSSSTKSRSASKSPSASAKTSASRKRACATSTPRPARSSGPSAARTTAPTKASSTTTSAAPSKTPAPTKGSSPSQGTTPTAPTGGSSAPSAGTSTAAAPTTCNKLQEALKLCPKG